MNNTTDSQALARLQRLFDEGNFRELSATAKAGDKLTGVICAYGEVNGNAVYAFSQDKTVASGAVSRAHAEKIAKLYALAAKTGAPVVGIHDSNGAFVDGTAESLTAYGEMLSIAAQLSGVVPQISVVAGTCIGSAALLACASDYLILTKDSAFYLSPPNGNEAAGTAAAAAKAGTAALVCEDDMTAIDKTRALLNLLPVNNLSGVPMFEFDAPAAMGTASLQEQLTGLADTGETIELYADFGTAAYTGFCTMGGSTVGIAATNKTASPLTADDCAKLARFVRTCDAFSIPVITLLDTPGFAASAEAELTGSVKAMTRLMSCYAEATTVKLSVITGSAVGAAFTTLAGKACGADFTYAWNNAIIAPMAPLSAVEFLWHDKLKGAADVNAKRKELADEYAATLASAQSAAERNVIDAVISPADTRETLLSALDVMAGKRVTKLPKKHNNLPF